MAWNLAGRFESEFVIERVGSMENIEDDLRERIIAEAKFIRALVYFNGVRLFGGLPIITSAASDNLFVSRATKEETYQQIITDLTEAADVLPVRYSGRDNAEVGRATRGAALGILAKVYLTQGDYASAESTALEVTTLGYALNTLYSQNFEPINENDSESIFEVQFSSGAGFGAFDKNIRDLGHLNSQTPEEVESHRVVDLVGDT